MVFDHLPFYPEMGKMFFWMGREEGYHGVGVLVAEEWIEKVLDVKRWSERIMVLRVVVGRSVVNLISVVCTADRERQGRKRGILHCFREDFV